MAANWHKKELLIYKMKNKMLLSTKYLKTKQLSKKLDYNQIKLFKIKKLMKLLYKAMVTNLLLG